MRSLRPYRSARAFVLPVLVVLCLLMCAPVASAGAPPDRYAAIDAYVRHRMEATHTPGLSYAVVGPDGPLHQRSWGTDGRGEPVTARTPFVWGSLAKPVTATAVMTLVQSGRLRLDDRVVGHLPGFRFGGAAHASRVTVRHLLTQTAGIPASATSKVTDCYGPDCPLPAKRLRALDGITPLGPPGTEYAYTSANYVVLTALVEAVTGRPFAEYLRQAVLAPAGMNGAIADAASARQRRLPPGHQLLWGFPVAVADGFDDHGAGYGYMGGDLGDLSAFASLQLRAGRTAGGGTVLTTESVRLMREEGLGGSGYGLGWRIGGLDAPLDTALWHTGGTPGYSAMMFVLPQRNVALVVEQNLYGLLQDAAVMRVGFGAARILAGGRPGPDPSALPYLLTVWGVTGLAAAFIVAAGRSALLLRRPTGPASPRLAVTVGWVLAGALPAAAVAALAVLDDMKAALVWVPDAVIALWTASAAGTAVAALRIVRAARARRRIP
ncbi:serine hydrolase domain-containing protein [Actinomadura bangladeshensis]|uniref:Class A beta-lactamase-related serine hydrolase n=1 Tax=Actinomadura bangladeshensis TaxID=453573 RepID=A0A4R4NTU7_9ACTN|nr:serine hydrolase domain-containing protein [Actinomadura bangladeshensis]TDC13171.1 class A beta-lactamase-related serine hydrolase [Actinomadura bangladeshensis]